MAIDPDVEAVLAILESRLSALESGNAGDLTDLENRVSTLETAINAPINPHTVIQQYDDNSEIVYKKE